MRENVEEAIERLNLELSEEQIVQACDEVLEAFSG